MDGVIFQCLTNCIWVGLDSVHNEPPITSVARIFLVLKSCLNKLSSYYKNLKPDSMLPVDSQYFPLIMAYSNHE
jgi:hypothetical protein